jgi:hypothetical protein
VDYVRWKRWMIVKKQLERMQKKDPFKALLPPLLKRTEEKHINFLIWITL